MRAKYLLSALIFMMMATQFIAKANPNLTTRQIGTKEIHSVNGFLENKGQIADQVGNVRTDLHHIYANKSFRCQLKTNNFSYELSQMNIKKTATSMADYEGLPGFARYNPEIKWNTHRIDIVLDKSNPNPEIESFGKSDDYFNFYYPWTSNKGANRVHYFEKVVYSEIYPGIDFVFYTTPKGIKYDIIIKPGANPNDIKMIYKGADDIFINETGKLRIHTTEGFIEEQIVSSYYTELVSSPGQSTGEPVKVSYKLTGDIISFDVPDYDVNKTLIIDPEIVWGTYYGDVYQDGVNAIQHDELNNIIGTGYTANSSNIASSGAYQTTYGGGTFDAFLVKLDHSGRRKWCTYVGGDGLDVAQGVAADNVWHSLYIMGYTNSQNGLSSQGAYQEDFGMGYFDGFLGKFDQNGQREWCTYYGGSGIHDLTGGEFIFNAAIDEKFGDIYFTGTASSNTGIASSGAHQTTYGGYFDAMLVKFTADGDRAWGTYVGGAGFDGAYGITLDPSGYITIGGYTESDNSGLFGEELIATEGAYQFARSGSNDAFLERFNLRGTRQWGTYFGGPYSEIVNCTAADKDKNIYIGGYTNSTSGIATSGAHQSTKDSNQDGFFAKFSSSGNRLFASYYGGERAEEISAMYCNDIGYMIFTGSTTSKTAIATTGSFQDTFIGQDTIIVIEDDTSFIVMYDGMVAYFSPLGVRQWGSYLGGWDDDLPKKITIDKNQNIIICGETRSVSMLATQGAYDNTYSDTTDGFIIKFGEFLKLTNVTTPFCVGNPISVAYETGVDMNTGNIFTAQLSDSNGVFTSPVNIGTKSGITDGTINCVIPSATVPATGYRIRVVSSNPQKISNNNGSDITINPLPNPVIAGMTPACSRETITYTAQIDANTDNQWFVTNGKIIGDSTFEYAAIAWNDAASGKIKVIQTNTLTSCVDSIERTIQINVTPIPNIIGESEVIANTNETYRTPSQSYLEFKWSATGGTITNNATNSEVEVKWGNTGTGTIKLVVKHKTTGCTDSLTLTVAINSTPIKISGKKTVCSASNEIYSLPPLTNTQYKWSVSGGVLQESNTDTVVTITWGAPGTGVITVIRTNTTTQVKDTVVTNINILVLPVVAILGISEICESFEDLYIAVNTDSVTSQWEVFNGIIIGSSTGDTAIVRWNKIPDGNDSVFVIGSVSLTQTSIVTGCQNTKTNRVNISANPDALINGDSSACEGSFEHYSTSVLDNGFLNEWMVTGGTIIGTSSDTTLQVEWGAPGMGSIKLIQTSSTLCKDSNLVQVTINTVPSKPTISQKGKVLESSSNEGNQWYSNGVEIVGQNKKQFAPSDSGYFTVQVTDVNGCISPMSAPYFFDIKLYVHDFVSSSGFINIYPNPTYGRFILSLNDSKSTKIQLQIRNITGELILLKEFINDAKGFEKTLDISGISSGIYILEVIAGTEIYIGKLTKY